jgi:hypothetical protein
MMWRPDRLLKAILIWTMITLLLVWLPLVRGLMDGESYQWGGLVWGFEVGGYGLHGQYWVLLLQAAFGITPLPGMARCSPAVSLVASGLAYPASGASDLQRVRLS